MGNNDGNFFAKLIIILILLLILVVFALRNNDIVTVDLFFKSIDISLAFLILICAIIGALIVGGVLSIKTFATSSQNRKLKKTIKNKDDEILNLKAKLSVLESEARSRDRQVN